MSFFPRHTGAFSVPITQGSFRTLPRSLVVMAALTGLSVRLARSIFLGQDPAPRPFALWGFYVLGSAFILAMAALHLSNFTVRRWLWRAPVFVLLEVATEMLVSALLIVLDREPSGTGSAHLHDWPSLAASTLLFRTLLVLPFILVLAGIVQMVRVIMVRRRV